MSETTYECVCEISEDEFGNAVTYINPKCVPHMCTNFTTASEFQCICGLSSTDAYHCPVHHTVKNRQREVAAALTQLRYGASVGMAVPDWDVEARDFLVAVSQWLELFGQTIASVSDTTTNMAEELVELRSQRKAVRDFLGLSTMTGEL